MTDDADPVHVVADLLLTLRRRQRRSHLAAGMALDQVRIAEVADVVANHDEPVTVGDVARELTIDPSQASRRVAAAVAAGTVVRVPLQHDGRLSGLQLTEKGRDVADDIQRRRRSAVESAIQSWPAADQRGLATLLGRLVADLNALP